MTRNFQTLDLVILSSFFLTVETLPGEILPPQNVSLRWIDDLTPQLSWEPQHSLENCRYIVQRFKENGEEAVMVWVKQPPWEMYTVMDGGFLRLSLKTSCNNKESDPVENKIIYQVTDFWYESGLGGVASSERGVKSRVTVLKWRLKTFLIHASFRERRCFEESDMYMHLAKDLQCYIRSTKDTRCSWIPAGHAQDVHFFYQLVNENRMTPAADRSPPHFQVCPSYVYTDGIRTGCDLEARVTQDVHVLFNGTLNNGTVRNTFRKELISNMRPPPLKWNVTKDGDKFIISWSPPDILQLSSWKFTINYTECNERKWKDIHGETSAELDLVSLCPYRMAIKASTRGGETPWSEEKYFNAETGQNTLAYAVIIPLIFAGLAALALACCRKNKDSIFPIIPEPVDLLSDISDNNNKSTFCNLYIPSEEEKSCKITLVTDSKN